MSPFQQNRERENITVTTKQYICPNNNVHKQAHVYCPWIQKTLTERFQTRGELCYACISCYVTYRIHKSDKKISCGTVFMNKSVQSVTSIITLATAITTKTIPSEIHVYIIHYLKTVLIQNAQKGF
jgi:hypothetical protein